MTASGTSTPVVTSLSIEVRRAEVVRALGYPRARAPSAQVESTLDRLWEVARGLVVARGIYHVVEAEVAAATGMPQVTPLVGLGLSTIGCALEDEAIRLSQEGLVLEALALDAFGSAAAEAAADALDALICALASAQGYGLSVRTSPGYGRWDLGGQRELLRSLSAEAIGVQLTEGLMMVPRKSVSFGVRFVRQSADATEQPSRARRRRCAACDLASCAYREEEMSPDPGTGGG